jgi:hypothetical protein
MIRILPLAIANPAGYERVQIRLNNAVNGELSGASSVMLVQGASSQETLVATGSVWKFSDTGTDRGTAWRQLNYDDTSWGMGAAELGFGDDDEVTLINGGPSNARYPTAYFRRAIVVDDPGRFAGLDIHLRHDDGGVVYLNGQEVFRSNMPAGTISYTTLAPGSPSSETAFFSTNISASVLVSGTNLVAVEVHQSSATSSDLSFELELTGSVSPVLKAIVTPDDLLLYWEGSSFILEQSAGVDGPWTPVPEASSPWSVAPTQPWQFFRLRSG